MGMRGGIEEMKERHAVGGKIVLPFIKRIATVLDPSFDPSLWRALGHTTKPRVYFS
jgi:hypothetical protein